ncbi:hypothetical protein OA88_05390 [Flavobacterium sp. JRM]|nr:hypothetical protein OA88_05390 [Flavobacterium sp. JRM]
MTRRFKSCNPTRLKKNLAGLNNIMKIGVLAPIVVKSLFEKSPYFFLGLQSDQRKLCKHIEKWDFKKSL